MNWKVTFDDIALKYDSWDATPIGSIVDRLERQAILPLLDIMPGELVLDVGCGTGKYSLEMARKGARVTGLDISENMLQLARDKAIREGLSIEFIHGDATRLPYPSVHFDWVTSFLALEFTGEAPQVLAEITRVLKPGGRLVVSTLNKNSLWTVVRRWKGRSKSTVYNHATFLSEGSLRRFLASNNLQITTFKRIIYLPPVDHPLVIRYYPFLEQLGRLFYPFAAVLIAAAQKK